MSTLAVPTPADDQAAVTLARRVNLWLGKFASPNTGRAYADDLGFPHELRDAAWHPAPAPGSPTRGRRPLRRGVAFFPWCADRGLDPLHGVSLEEVQQWVRAIEAAGLAKRTRARMVTAAEEFYVAMQRQGLQLQNPVALVDRRAAELTGIDEDDDQVLLDVDQVRQLLTAARRGSGRGRDLYRERDLVVLLILAVTGARASEVTGLDLSDYRRAAPGGKAELVLHGKGGKVRTAPIDAQVADDVDAWLRVRAERFGGSALPVPSGQAAAGRQPLLSTRTGARLTPSYLGHIIRTVARRDGCPLRGIATTLHPHALRAAFVTAALDARVPIDQVRSAVGHASISTTLRYDRRRNRRATQAFAVVSGLLTDAPAPADAPAVDVERHVAEAVGGYAA